MRWELIFSRLFRIQIIFYSSFVELIFFEFDSSFTFAKMVKSDLSDLPSEVTRSAVFETVEDQLKSKNFIIRVSSASEAGENNFTGVVHRISFSEKGADEGDNGKSLVHKLILKVATQDLILRNRRFTRPSFLREAYMYEKVSSRRHCFLWVMYKTYYIR